MRTVFGLLAAIGVLCHAALLRADDNDVEFFEKKIRPVLIASCYECHSADSKKLGGGLRLDSRDGLMKGGDSGTAIRAGHPDDSLLVKVLRHTDDNVKMPPKGKLPDSVIADIETWVKQGAVDPRVQSAPAIPDTTWADILRERSDWWSLKSVKQQIVPPSQQGNRNTHPVDSFVQAKLAEHGLAAAEPATPQTLARRLSLVLTGLPPTAEQVQQFIADVESDTASSRAAQAAIARYVDSLLQSPHFGEHWARHWMDVVRFTETHGNEWNYEVHHAWRYRDYLIRAFNDDVPYDQFVREHIAGDLLPQPRWNLKEQFNESIIGTGFYRFGEVNHDDCISLRSIGYDLLDNQIDTLTKAFQATTVACARCHNHKLDAVSSEDYYSLLAVLRSSRIVSHSIDSPEVNEASRRLLGDLKRELRTELARAWKADLQQLAQYMNAAQARRTKSPQADELTLGLNIERLEEWIAALAPEKKLLEDPLDLWRRLVEVDTPLAGDAIADALNPSSSFQQTWEAWAERVSTENVERANFNRDEFTTYADFRFDEPDDWQAGGQGMRGELSRTGEFVLQPDGATIVQSILPAGRYTHVLSAKQNGTLRSPVLPAGKKQISFQVVGQRSSAVRLVSNNCQLNYSNYRALISPDLHWITFAIPEDRESLRTYAELMTMFDNPKFPDQLSALGGDKDNYKLPWDKAAENPRSYFGITRVVLHDGKDSPKAELSHVLPLLADDVSNDQIRLPAMSEITTRYVDRITAAVNAWVEDRASEDDVRWINTLVRRNLLTNDTAESPRLDALVNDYRQIESQLSVPRVIAGIGDGGPGIEQPVFIRGDCNRPGELAPRRYLEVLSRLERPETIPAALTADRRTSSVRTFQSAGSGRLELANMIASSSNPLTSRVIVNRIWHHLFGTGLVRTVDDFGHVGELPSHPELLDYLADQFVQDGWSIKRLIRTLVLTKTFQLSNQPSAAAREIDPQGRLLQHYPARRMEAESVRDSILAASGRLDRTLFGQSIQPYRDKDYADRRLFAGPLDGNGRRSVYTKNNLMEAPKFLSAFNLPGGKVAQGRRDVTNVPAQALALLNDPFVLQQAEVWSQRVLARENDSIESRLDDMFRSAINRSPTSDELVRFQQAINELASLYDVPSDQVLANSEIWKDIAHALFNLNELIYIP